jgi:hypothetical protein
MRIGVIDELDINEIFTPIPYNERVQFSSITLNLDNINNVKDEKHPVAKIDTILLPPSKINFTFNNGEIKDTIDFEGLSYDVNSPSYIQLSINGVNEDRTFCFRRSDEYNKESVIVDKNGVRKISKNGLEVENVKRSANATPPIQTQISR